MHSDGRNALKLVGPLACCLVVLFAIGCGGGEPASGDERGTTAVVVDDTTNGATEGSETAAPASSSNAPPETAGAALSPPMQSLLEAHNRLREAHCAPPLHWSVELGEAARAWAQHLSTSGCNLAHSDSPHGENLAGASAGTLSPEGVAELWHSERAHYDFRRGGFSMRTGHFTQLVWAGSERLGCASTSCGGLDLWVCKYDPPGNVRGEYRSNVAPEGCENR